MRDGASEERYRRATGALVHPGESTHDLLLHSGTGEQLAENRWSARPVWSQAGLACSSCACAGCAVHR